MRSTRFTAISLATLFALAATTARADNEGLADLDKATDLQLQAQSLQDLEQVVQLCETAIKKGLDKDNTGFAKQLMVSSLWQHAQQLSSAVLGQRRLDPRDPRLKRILDSVKGDLDKLLSHDENFVEAHVMLAKLQVFPGGKRERAVKAANKAIELYKERGEKKELAETLLLRARLRENADDRLADINEAVKIDPSAQALQLRAAAHVERGELDKALGDFEDLLKQNPKNVAVHQAIANTYAALKKPEKAIEALTKAIELAPENALNYTLRAELYESQEKLDEALADLNQALKVQPSDLLALMARSRLHYFKKDVDAARSDVKRVLQQRPGLGQAVLLKSMIEAEAGDYVQAIKDLQSVLRSDPTNIGYRMQLASFYTLDQRPRKAIQVLTKVLGDDESNWQAMRQRGDALLSVGKHSAAIEDYTKALELAPEDDGVLNNLAWVLATSPMDDIRDGKRSVELATKACEVTDFEKPHILSTLAASYAETGDFENAIKWSTKAVELGEEDLKEQIDQLKDELKHYQDGKPFRELQEVKEKPDPPARVLET
jgi:tetratricopeptide (TPR) repeat protein